MTSLTLPSSDWRMPKPYGWRAVLVGIVIAVGLIATGRQIEIGRMASMTGEGVLASVGLRDGSQVTSGLGKAIASLWPPQISDRIETARIENFDPAHLPWFARVETIEVVEKRLDPDTLTMKETVSSREFLVRPLGYLFQVAALMLETLEMAVWGTLLAVLWSVPLAIMSARNYTPHPIVYYAARAWVSLLRSVPELVSSLFLVLAYGFGPTAGVLALALHSAGFLGKFYAEDIEGAASGPQEALRAIGAGPLSVLRHAVWPQVRDQYVAYTLYVLDRNVRMATVVGLVGAGGIGQELKGRYDMFNYAHVGTILVAIFITVFLLDQLAAWARRRPV